MIFFLCKIESNNENRKLLKVGITGMSDDLIHDISLTCDVIWRKFPPLHLFMFCFTFYSHLYDCLPTV